MTEAYDRPPAACAETPDYVYYEYKDYAGFWRRAAAVLVDLAGLCVLLALFATVCWLLGSTIEEAQDPPAWLWACLLTISYLYLTVLKRSRIRTPGYWVTGVRIVNLKGKPPSIWTMTLRLFWWVLGPINSLLDLIFITSDEHRQTVRDLLVGTYVIRRNARPAGLGHKIYRRLAFMGLFLPHPQVKPVAKDED